MFETKWERFKYGLIVNLSSYPITILECLVGIATLGYYNPNWTLKYIGWALTNYPKFMK